MWCRQPKIHAYSWWVIGKSSCKVGWLIAYTWQQNSGTRDVSGRGQATGRRRRRRHRPRREILRSLIPHIHGYLFRGCVGVGVVLKIHRRHRARRPRTHTRKSIGLEQGGSEIDTIRKDIIMLCRR